jgi:ribonuclease R
MGLTMPKSTSPRKKTRAPAKAALPDAAAPYRALPTTESIVEAMRLFPDLDGKRDLARHFGIKGDQRGPFKALLKQMEGEGHLTRSRKHIHRTATLPSVTVLDIPGDANPDNLHAYPAQWRAEDGEKPRVTVSEGGRVAPAPGDRILARIDAGDNEIPVYVAKPMKILDKPRRGQIGIVRLDEDGARLVPVDRKAKEMRIERGDLGDAKDGDLVEGDVKITGRLMIPRARVINVIGNPKSEGAVSMIAIHNLDIPYIFPSAVIAESEQAVEASLKGREDWRHIPLITIDPADAKDHDDAVYAEPDSDPANPGGYIVYVAIADVAAYVRPGTALDREAFVRGNSVYFPDRVVPMLPERISNDLCSLREGENRPSLAVRMQFDAQGRKIAHSFHRVLFRSAAKLSYQQAQAAIDGKPDDKTGPILETILRPLWAAYGAMSKARDHRGPLDLDLPERKIILDSDGMVSDVRVPERLDAHRLIEEMMIAANVAAAETLEKHRSPLLYRVHDAPSQEKLVALRDFLASLSLPAPKQDAVRPVDFNRILDKARADGKIQQVSEIVLRTQAQAEYSADNYGHFGLNLDRYAHFTSPIRRYSDLIVHRALVGALRLGDDGLTDAEIARLPSIAEHISTTERRAMLAERETVDRLLAHFLADRVGAQFEGRVSGVTRSGLFIRLKDTGADGFVPASSIGDDYFRFIEEAQAMVGDKSGETFRIGDDVRVRLLEVAPIAGALRFELLSEGTRGDRSSGNSRPQVRRKGWSNPAAYRKLARKKK